MVVVPFFRLLSGEVVGFGFGFDGRSRISTPTRQHTLQTAMATPSDLCPVYAPFFVSTYPIRL